MQQPSAEHTGVIAPPPVIYLAAFALTLVIHALWPLRLAEHPALPWLGGALVVLGVVVNGWGFVTLRRNRTPVHPGHAATQLVTAGPFRFSRNPLYLGLNGVFLGLVLVVDTAWGLVALAAVLAVMHYGVVLREERHLAARFGAAYRAYRERVRRYL